MWLQLSVDYSIRLVITLRIIILALSFKITFCTHRKQNATKIFLASTWMIYIIYLSSNQLSIRVFQTLPVTGLLLFVCVLFLSALCFLFSTRVVTKEQGIAELFPLFIEFENPRFRPWERGYGQGGRGRHWGAWQFASGSPCCEIGPVPGMHRASKCVCTLFVRPWRWSFVYTLNTAIGCSCVSSLVMDCYGSSLCTAQVAAPCLSLNW